MRILSESLLHAGCCWLRLRSAGCYGTHLHTILVPGTLINRNCEKCSLYENYGCNLVRVNQLRDRNHNFRIDYTFWRRFSVTFSETRMSPGGGAWLAGWDQPCNRSGLHGSLSG
jgi:hypothetical protein